MDIIEDQGTNSSDSNQEDLEESSSVDEQSSVSSSREWTRTIKKQRYRNGKLIEEDTKQYSGTSAELPAGDDEFSEEYDSSSRESTGSSTNDSNESEMSLEGEGESFESSGGYSEYSNVDDGKSPD